ncbi:MAG TPA: Ig-like domain-containing protein [Pyrinomonadaceae bacterium]|nr:Ig-like domain-containing protein [Pyrinomonadaceae bacterium]
MQRARFLFPPAGMALLIVAISMAVWAQTPTVKTVEIKSNQTSYEVGQHVLFTATAKDQNGATVNEKPARWFAAPFDLAAIDADGNASFYQPGEVIIGVFVAGKPHFSRIKVNSAPPARIGIAPVSKPLVTGGTYRLSATAYLANGDPRSDVVIAWSSDNPEIATVDTAGVVTGKSPGTASIRAKTGAATGSTSLSIVSNTITALSIEPASSNVSTGDVVRFRATATGGRADDFSPRWTVGGEGATIDPDGGFVAEQPGTYLITASVGERTATASVVVTPRNAERSLQVVGRAELKDVQAAEEWITGNFAYVSTISDHFLVYDISDPAHPKLTEKVKVDARLINDISTTPDGKILVISREEASNRKNGIAFYDSSNPAHPKLISDYTATVTGGVHSAFVDSHYVYLTDDATGSMRVIDFADVKNPKEVARWEVKNDVANSVKTKEGVGIHGRYLHDLQVKDGLAYLAYWRDGLVILDVGNGVKGGSPENPQLVSQFHFNHNELYGNGWLAGTHSVFRYKNYVFIGDEVFPAIFVIQAKQRIPVRGIVHVVDVSDLQHPRKVAEYPVPEAGAHNMWVDNDVLYMGYYTGGARILDVSGELRGDLYRQGREVSRLWTGDAEGFRPNMPFCWGAQPHNGLVYFNDINSGLWIVKIGEPIDKGSTTTPGQ